MKNFRLVSCLSVSMLLSPAAFAEEAAPSSLNEGLYGTALPVKGLLGVEAGLLFSKSTGKSYDANGNRVDAGYRSFGYGTGFKLGYALTNTFTMGLRIEFAHSNSLEPTSGGRSSFESGKDLFIASASEDLLKNVILPALKAKLGAQDVSDEEALANPAVKAAYESAQVALPNLIEKTKISVEGFQQIATSLGGALDEASAKSLVNRVLKDLRDKQIPVENGDMVKEVFNAEKNFNNYLARREVKPGVKDLEIGAIYTICSSNAGLGAICTTPDFDLGTQLAVTAPSGAHKDVAWERSTNGNGMWDGAWTLTATYKIARGIHVAASDEVRYALSGSSRKTESGTEIDERWSGLRHKGYLGVAWGLGNISDELRTLKLTNRFKFEFDRRYDFRFAGGEWIEGKNGRNTEWETNLSLNTFNLYMEKSFPIPVEVEGGWVWPLNGKNQGLIAHWPSLMFRTFVPLTIESPF